ncbi:integral peroxisomal membrane peroxin-domain-containing protein [Leptodontidium sp. 2 PMI_412]|nr:integral peroxisomal membrane peroxin-domain-containing protein [Leptodontidium sp. MPI-SDFR-AT-0119]KAH9223238.1 integral peroxisomal membrane peroxin-domain-containing protein [Leptodontidium sp. 2 PMI_412]
MDEFTVDSFVNRDDPIPVISFDTPEDLSDEVDNVSDVDRRRDRFRKRGKDVKENMKKVQQRASETGSSIQDRLLEKLLQQVIPIEDLPSSRAEAHPTQDYTSRPSFSLPTMSANFRRFNARIGVVFVFQAKVIRLLSWNTPTHTLSFLAIYTFICLDPYLLTVLPFAVILLALLIPAFISRHPAPPPTITTFSSHTASFGYNAAGPPLAPAPTVKPVKELSKDFFRNMRDLQNCMEDFSRVHDKVISLLTPPTNFSNEPLSSTLFLFAFSTALIMFIASHLLPWRIIFLTIGWVITASSHPTIQRQLITTHKTHVAPREEEAKSYLDSWIAKDIILDSAPETREVEIFELQRLSSAGEWESWLFTSSPYDPLSEGRIRSERPKGTRFFEDVQPPLGWEWSEKKWALDLWSREWVEERIITGVEVETEGERWVYDIRYEYEDVDLGLMYGGADSDHLSTPTKGKKKMLPSWEEGSDAENEGRGRRGEWRRRRWVRMVKRKWQARRSVSEGSKM